MHKYPRTTAPNSIHNSKAIYPTSFSQIPMGKTQELIFSAVVGGGGDGGKGGGGGKQDIMKNTNHENVQTHRGSKGEEARMVKEQGGENIVCYVKSGCRGRNFVTSHHNCCLQGRGESWRGREDNECRECS